jgi:tRNA-specific 2-thiouridylase
VDDAAFEHHLRSPAGRGHEPNRAHHGAAGGAACGDVVRIVLSVDGERVSDAGFQAAGCGATQAADSAAVSLLQSRTILEAACLGAREIAEELGGLSPGKLHAAELAADALHRALGSAAAASAAVARRDDRILVAMSGGVDSAVAALVCARYDKREVVAVTLELWADAANDGERSCCSAQAVRGARALAHRMGLPHLTLDLREEFRAGVVEPYLHAHADGLTPNPCVGCNGHVRLDAMLALAERLGCGRGLATGHYARTARDEETGGALLRVGADPNKDQSYMLAALQPATLARLCFPLGELRKAETRALAAEAGLPVADKPDSQDLCFLAGTDRARFLERHARISEAAGEIVDQAGTVLGRHRGARHYTVGQRRGLGVAAPEPLYVLRTDLATNRVTVGPRAALREHRVHVRGARLHRHGAHVDRVKLRYRSHPLPARLREAPPAGRHPRLTLDLAEPAEGGAAPGQVACLMQGDVVVGWGTIARR